MKILSHSIVFLLLTYCVAGYAEPAYWNKRISKLDYDKASTRMILTDLERISQDFDPEGMGFQFVLPLYRNPNTRDTTLHLTNITLKEAVQWISEVTDFRCIFGENHVYLCGGQEGGPLGYHRAGVVGRLVDADSQTPITNAVFVSDYNMTNSVAFMPDGRFIAAIDYYINRPFCDGVFIYRTEDDEFRVTVSSPGYDTQVVQISGGDRQADEIMIEMKKVQQAVPGYPPQSVGSPDP